MTDQPAAEVLDATVWLDASRQGATLQGVPCRVGIELEARQFVLELPDGRQAKLKLSAAQELIIVGNSANGHGAVNPGQCDETCTTDCGRCKGRGQNRGGRG